MDRAVISRGNAKSAPQTSLTMAMVSSNLKLIQFAAQTESNTWFTCKDREWNANNCMSWARSNSQLKLGIQTNSILGEMTILKKHSVKSPPEVIRKPTDWLVDVERQQSHKLLFKGLKLCHQTESKKKKKKKDESLVTVSQELGDDCKWLTWSLRG